MKLRSRTIYNLNRHAEMQANSLPLRTKRRSIKRAAVTKKTGKKPLTTFTKFPKLPPELRVMVWEHALSVPRIIGLHHQCINHFNYFSPVDTSHTLQHVNYESKSEASRKRKSCLEVLPPEPWPVSDEIRLKLRSAPDLLINQDTDIVWVQSIRGYFMCLIPDYDQYINAPTIKRLALNYSTWDFITERVGLYPDFFYEEFKKLWVHNASELILVVNDRDYKYGAVLGRQWFRNLMSQLFQDLIFVKPKPKAAQKLKYRRSPGVFRNLQPQRPLTWELMEEYALQFLDSLRRHGKPGDTWRSNIKRIRFVEARKIGDRCLSQKKVAMGRVSPDVYLRE
jgi:hypothetical protein